MLVGHIAVAEHRRVDLCTAHQLLQLALGKNRNSGGIARPRQTRRIAAILNVGNLRRSEGDNFIGRVLAEVDVEIVKIAPGSAHDDDSLHHCSLPSSVTTKIRRINRSPLNQFE